MALAWTVYATMTALLLAVIALLYNATKGIADGLDRTNDRIDTLGTRLDERIDTTNQRIDTTNDRIDALGTRLDERIDTTNQRIDTTNERIDALADNLRTEMRQNKEEILARLDIVAERLAGLERAS